MSTRLDAAILRAEFDRAFAEKPAEAAEAPLELIAIELAGETFLVSLEEVAGLHADRVVAPVPSPDPKLLGLVAVRGLLAPAWELRALLGFPRAPAPRWLLLAKARPIALAFDRLAAHLRLPRAALTPATEHARPHVDALVRTPNGVQPKISLASILAALARQQGG